MTQETHKRLRDALDAARRIEQQVSGMSRVEYDADPWFQSAVERQVEIIGEALNHVRRLDPGIEAVFPDIHEWVAMRNLVAHIYDKVDHDIVWDTVTREIPELVQRIRQILASM